ncbi:MAG: helix-turn-helix transcriptional regulator [Oscillibacter sp.]|nr:helix-turn-helix transcriptional regulator [Oscillibacter sp.]
MSEMFIGETIRLKRSELGLTQEELCAGLCDPSTLSRIETGKQAPSRNLANALLQRLGLPHDRYYALETFLTSSEVESDTLRAKIDGCIARFRQSLGEERRQARLEALEHLNRLEAGAETDDNIARQYILAARAALGSKTGAYGFERRRRMLLEAIRLTVPQFDIDVLDGRLYSIDETGIISQIAEAYSDAGQHKKAADIFSQLLTYVQDHYQNVTHPSRYLSPAALNYARELCLMGCYEDALRTAELGRKACRDYGFCQPLPGLLAVMAECRHEMGEYGQSRDLYCQAYYLYLETGNASGLADVEEAAAKRLGLTFPPREGRV